MTSVTLGLGHVWVLCPLLLLGGSMERKRARIALVDSTDADAADVEVLRAIYPGLRRFAAAWAPLEVDPDDLLQEAIARTLAAGPLARLDNPGAYLRTVIANVARASYGR